MSEVIGDILTPALGVALSPLPIVAFILILATPKARANGPAFTAGWVIGLTVLVAAVALLTSGADADDADPATWTSVLKLALGALLVALAVRQWRSRPKEGETVPTPKWMEGLDTMPPGRVFGLGALLGAVNPKNLAMGIAAAATIGDANLATGQFIVAVLVFVVIASISLLVPLVIYFAGGASAAKTLDGWKTWLVANNGTVMAVLFLVLGVNLIGKGIGAL